MLYAFFKLLLRPTLWVFFQRIDIRGREHLPATGSLLVVANHPNTLMDPILVGMLWRRPLSFLAKSPFFKGLMGSVMRAFHAIPLYRKEDTAAAVAGAPVSEAERARQNDESFRASFELLAEGGALLIFPEGSSILERRLRPLKTGAARIALGAEAHHGWGLGVRIVPVGLNYADAQRFRSRVFISIGEPLELAAWRDRYEADSFGAARDLTEEIRQALENELLVTRSEEDDQFIRALETLYKPYLRATPPPELAGQPAAARDFELSRSLIEAVAWFEAHDPARVNDIRRRVFAYQHALQRLGFGPEDPLHRQPGGPARAVPGPGRQLLGLFLGGPLWLWGAVNNYLPYWLPARVANRLTKDVEFIAPIMMVTGMITFPLFYWLQTWLVWRLTHSALWTTLYLLSLPVTGFFALAFSRWLTAWRGQWRMGWLGRKRESLLAALQQERTALLADLEQARAEWREGTGRS